MRATSNGFEVILSPCSANRTTTVNSRPHSATGAMRGRNFCSYQVDAAARASPMRRVR